MKGYSANNNRIKQLRLRRRLSAKLVAERAGISRATLWLASEDANSHFDPDFILYNGKQYDEINHKMKTLHEKYLEFHHQ